MKIRYFTNRFRQLQLPLKNKIFEKLESQKRSSNPRNKYYFSSESTKSTINHIIPSDFCNYRTIYILYNIYICGTKK